MGVVLRASLPYDVYRCLTTHLADDDITTRMDYEATLDRAMEELPDFEGSDERLDVPDAEAQKDGAFTRLTNLSTVGDALNREPDHIHSSIQQELGTAGQYEDGRARYNGEFSGVLPVGDQFAVIDKNNYTSVRKNVTVQAGQTTDLSDIELDYASNTGGTITLAPNNPGESVSVTISGGGEFSNTVSLNTSNRTTYDFSTDVNVDGYTVTYEADKYSTVIETVAVDVNETVQQNVTLRARRAR